MLLALAALSLALRVLIPAGFMLDNAPSDGGVRLVICTGHGPLRSPGEQHKAPAKPSADGVCAFAAHAAAAAPAAPVPAKAGFTPILVEAPPAPEGLQPGRGLAAPPPPSRGPPIV